jgi:hypothetical protein
MSSDGTDNTRFFPVHISLLNNNGNGQQAQSPARDGGECSTPRLGCFIPRKNSDINCTGGGWASGPVYMAPGSLYKPPFKHRTVQHVASCSTDYALLPACMTKVSYKFTVYYGLLGTHFI